MRSLWLAVCHPPSESYPLCHLRIPLGPGPQRRPGEGDPIPAVLHERADVGMGVPVGVVQNPLVVLTEHPVRKRMITQPVCCLRVVREEGLGVG